MGLILTLDTETFVTSSALRQEPDS